MNLGFYVETCGGTPQNTEIYNFLNGAISRSEIEDGAVFFNSVNFNPVTCKFGMFDATEIWHFTGNLICSSINNLRRCLRVVNDIKLAYLFTKDQKNEHNLFELVNIGQHCKVITMNDEDRAEFLRITGVEPVLLDGWDVEKFRGVFDG